MYFQFQKMYSCETVGKGACITRRGAVKNLPYKHHNEKNTNGERGGRVVKDMEFSWVLK